MDEEILQDFIVEAGEIIENLSEQLVDIEKNPEDKELLNAIFRGFHTVKGGAGFLQLNSLVEVCHAAESLFDELRNQRIKMSPALMDSVLQAYDEITVMFEEVKEGNQPEAAPVDLIQNLKAFARGEVVVQNIAPIVEEKVEEAPVEIKEEVVEPTPVEEPFDFTKDPEVNVSQASDSDDITDEEFEALLDQLHGKGHAPGQEEEAQESIEENKIIDDDPTDAEFNALLEKAKAEMAQKQQAVPTLKIASGEEYQKAQEQHKENKKPEPSKSAAADVEQTVRVDTKILDDIMNLVGELVLVRNRLLNMASRRNDSEISKTISNLDVVTGDLQNSVMKTRMQPVKKVFGRFPRVVRDLARKLNKKIELKMEGEETELDKSLVDALADPMIHMVRNCCDHGIETPAERLAAGKDESGTVLLSAAQQGDHILLRIIDDGKGMDPNTLRDIAVKKGILDESAAQRLSDDDALNLVFEPGFSTNKEVTDISGRGVGMDVVKTNISKLNGSVKVISTLGKGTTIEIKVPLTLAILPTLMICVDKRTFALPLTTVSEIFYLDLQNMRRVDGQNTIVIREKAIPLFFLKQWFKGGSIDEYLTHKAHIVLVQAAASQLVGFVVDDLLGQEEVVIKPLDDILRHTPGMAGATVTSDGGIALILDIPGLLRVYARKPNSKE